MSQELRSLRFRLEREAVWFELEELINRVDTHGIKNLSAQELTQLTALYRYTLSSLSTVRSISLDQNLASYLETLSARAYAIVYGNRQTVWQSLVQFIGQDFPSAVRELRWHVLVATSVLLAGSVVAFLMFQVNSEYFYAFVAPGMAGGRGPAATTEHLRAALFDKEAAGSDLAVFASFLVSNNAKIGMMCFALGFAAGLPVFYLLFTNGLVLGAFVGLYADRGLTVEFYSWILPHGITEMLAVILCGAAGFKIGQRMITPGEHSRWDAIKMAGREAGRVCIGAVGMFFIAAIIEGFFRQLVHNLEIRYLVAASSAIFWIMYFGFAGSRR